MNLALVCVSYFVTAVKYQHSRCENNGGTLSFVALSESNIGMLQLKAVQAC